MNLKHIKNCERNMIDRWSQFQLPNNWKNVGIAICILVILSLIFLKFIDTDYQWIKGVFRRGLLVGLLIVSLSKDKLEDEMIVSLRAKSFTLAFILGVLYALIQPAVTYVVHNLFFSSTTDNGFSYFEVLSYMLMIQIMFFEVLKRNR